MSDKIKLLELANKEVADDKNFIAFFLVKYSEIENISKEDIINNFKCNLETYYKLSLCRVPDQSAIDYITRLNKISEYVNINSLEINKIIKRVNSVLIFLNSNHNNYLSAARDKKNKNDSND
ncbi:hypothetical protein MH928_04470 [Flavobacterium sp. WW92]|uniref:hypothetical protein n=1 Tax=unclassified Flavobacterium TaxID=196869 RepID=UPI0022259F4A|nr:MULTISPECIES: hypothetical protein [unclassified Flavobacterium]WDO13957.1 hypothetical protein MH928_04470 [Flavobacterium sp. WW92]